MKPSDKWKKVAEISAFEGGLVLIGQEDFDGMMDELDELSPKEPEKVWPQKGDCICWAPLIGSLATDWFDPSNAVHKGILAAGLLSPTRDGAKANYAWLTSPITQARRRIEGLDGFSVRGNFFIEEWQGVIQRRAYISVHCGGLSFDTEAQADAALSTHEADIRLVLTGES